MKTTDFIPTDSILWMEVIPPQESRYHRWSPARPEIKGFFGIKHHARAEGWIDDDDDLVSEAKILEDERLFIDREKLKVMKKPCVKIVIKSGKYPAESFQYFDTIEESTAWAEEMAEKIPHIKVNSIG